MKYYETKSNQNYASFYFSGAFPNMHANELQPAMREAKNKLCNRQNSPAFLSALEAHALPPKKILKFILELISLILLSRVLTVDLFTSKIVAIR